MFETYLQIAAFVLVVILDVENPFARISSQFGTSFDPVPLDELDLKNDSVRGSLLAQEGKTIKQAQLKFENLASSCVI